MLVCAENLSRLDGIVHGFTTREGGVSTGELNSLNLGWREHEEPASLLENWCRVGNAIGVGAESIAMVDQVHGDVVVVANEGGGVQSLVGRADGLVCTVPGRAVAVRVADCVPVLLACRGVVAAVHAGWRGTAAAIVCRGVEAVCEVAGVAPHEIVAAIGPCIGSCCYEVGDEVVRGIGAHLDPSAFVDETRGAPHVDLALANQLLLEKMGLEDVEKVGVCTRCDPRFFSHRGDGARTGRFAGVIGLLEEPTL
ncbi:MAG: peptidoglycan editing factor PgeF [Myxococcota bacterium]|nr:peptidoglycan editing factor PgeF [Myxococcota bacterium]